MRHLSLLSVMICLVSNTVFAQDDEKPAALRALSTDRPDQTESPHSVDAGHVQLESDLVSYAITRQAGVTTREAHFANTNIRLGVADSVDVQLVLLPIVTLQSEAGGTASKTYTGFGDTTARVKINLVGNDDGVFALGLLPYVTFPTASRKVLGADKAQYGFAVPIGIDLPFGFGLGAMSEIDAVRDDGKYVAELTHTLTVSNAVVGDLGAFTEAASTLDLGAGSSASLELHGGLCFAVSDDIQLDGGVFGTLIGDGDDVRLFLGLTVRR